MWLSSNEKKIQFEDTGWIEPPAYPYGVYLDDSDNRGADDKICISDHIVTIELYTEFIDPDAKKAITDLFIEKALAYRDLGSMWIDSERHWQTVFEISYTEKI